MFHIFIGLGLYILFVFDLGFGALLALPDYDYRLGLALPDCQCSLSLLALLSRIFSQFKRGSVTRYSKELSRVVIDYPNSLYSLTASVDFSHPTRIRIPFFHVMK